MRSSSAVVVLSLTVIGAAYGEDHDTALRLREREEILPLEDLLRRAELGADVRILEIESELERGRRVYEVEYVDSGGRVREVLIDARTGEVLAHEEDN